MAKAKGKEKEKKGKDRKKDQDKPSKGKERAKKEKGNTSSALGVESDDTNDGSAVISYTAPTLTSGYINTNQAMFMQKLRNLEAEQTRDATDLIHRIRERDRLHYDADQLQAHESSRPGLTASTAYRQQKHHELRTAYERYEDFLFYQNEAHRAPRAWTVKHRKDKKGAAPSKTKLPTLYPYEVNEKFVKRTLDYYDKYGIGGKEYRAGRRDASGKKIKAFKNAIRDIRPADLHLWTPKWRRQPVGEGRQPLDRDIVYDPLMLSLDLVEIERRRVDIEKAPSQACTVGSMPDYKSHNDRREMEKIEMRNRENEVREIWGQDHWRAEEYNLRPSTSQMRLQKVGDTSTHQERFQEIQTSNGLFIAAKETSFDWLTSYDCLGLVQPGYTIDGLDIYSDGNESTTRLIAPGGGSDSDMSDEDIPKVTPEEIRITPKGPGVQLTAEERATRRERMKQKAAAAGAQTLQAAPAPALSDSKHTSGSKRLEAKEKAAEAERQLQESKIDTIRTRKRKREAGYIYTYEAHEFTKPKRKLREEHKIHITTVWAEATDGRRERHMGQHVRDSSPPASPPRLRLGFNTLHTSVPEGIPELDLNLPARKRCSLDPNCRKWWLHTKTEECWRAKLEDALYLGDEDEDPILPAVPTINGEGRLLPITRSGTDIYQSRLDDHYGLEKNGGLQWPTIGLRVPYAPTTIMNDRPLKSSDEEDRTEAYVFPVTRSLAVPLIDTPQRPWHVFNGDDLGVEILGAEEESESEDDGDKFRISYHEAAQPLPAPLPQPVSTDEAE